MIKRIYFSQDLEDRRADVVRNHWLSKPEREEAGFFDALSWGDATMAGPTTIRRLLAGALDNTSVTCVLIGSQTSTRRWMRYEIIQSIQRRNLLIGVHISGIPDKSQKATAAAPNPFEQIALAISEDGSSVKVLHYLYGAWLPYDDVAGWPLANPAPPGKRGKRIQLSAMYRVYDWVTDNGPDNFDKWVGMDQEQG